MVDPVSPSSSRGEGRNITRELRFVEAVERRAHAQREADDPQTRAALSRLARRLDSGEPLDRDVPPGHYLDIRA